MEVLKFLSCMTTWTLFTEQKKVLAGNLLISKILPWFETFNAIQVHRWFTAYFDLINLINIIETLHMYNSFHSLPQHPNW